MTAQPTDEVTLDLTEIITKSTNTGGIRHDLVQVNVFLFLQNGVFSMPTVSDALDASDNQVFDSGGTLVTKNTFTFNATNWDKPLTVFVSAVDDSVVDGGDTKVFAPALDTVAQILGPVIMGGAGGNGSLFGLNDPLMLPGELNVKPPSGDILEIDNGNDPGPAVTVQVDRKDLDGILLDQLRIRVDPDDNAVASPLASDSEIEDLVGKTLEIVRAPAAESTIDQFRLIIDVDIDDNGTGGDLTDDVITHTLNTPFDLATEDEGVVIESFTDFSDVPRDPDDTLLGADGDELVNRYTITSESLNFFVNEEESVDFLFVHDGDSPADTSAVLTTNRLFGLNMGPDTVIGEVAYQGGLTFDDLEVIDITLRSGYNDIDVRGTPTRSDGFQTWTIIHAGTEIADPAQPGVDVGDTVTVQLNETEVELLSGSGFVATNPEISTGFQTELTITHSGSFSADELIGQRIRITDGDSTIERRIVDNAATALNDLDDLSDNTTTLFLDSALEDPSNNALDWMIIDPADGGLAVELEGGDDLLTAAGSTRGVVVFGGDGEDTIAGGEGDDILFGDVGRVDFRNQDGAIVTRLDSTPEVITGIVEAPFPQAGNGTLLNTDQTIFPVADASTGAFGDPSETADTGLVGLFVDINNGEGFLEEPRLITANTASQLTVDPAFVLDRDGTSEFRISTTPEDQTDGVVYDPSLILAIASAGGDDDLITANGGDDVVIGGEGMDTIAGGSDDDVLFGDLGVFEFSFDTVNNSLDPEIGDVVATLLDNIRSIELAVGDNDIIFGNEHDDVVIGGAGSDSLDGDNITGTDDANRVNSGRDLIFGDNVALDRSRVGGIGSNAFEDFTNTRFRLVDPNTEQLYGSALNNGLDGEALFDGDDANADDPLNPDATQHFAFGQLDPDPHAVWAYFDIELLDHDLSVEGDPQNRFGDDYIAGGGRQDMIFGQLGDDVIQGDGGIASAVATIPVMVGASRSDSGDANADGAFGTLTVTASFEATTDGDDYIEGNGGNDVIFGNLGQDDIIGDNSDLFSLTTSAERAPTGSDIIFGGAGIRIDRSAYVEDSGADTVDIPLENRHARDSDMILGDNGRIIRIVAGDDIATSFVSFGYDALNDTTTQGEHYHLDFPGYDGSRGDDRIVVRVAELLDYTPGGVDVDPAAAGDFGQRDEVHGESGDDFVYGQVGDDVLFGDSGDDDLIGGQGHDWISGGMGQDGVLGGDGRIFTSRNVDVTGQVDFSEPLYGILEVETDEFISTPGKIQQATIHLHGELKKTFDLTPFFPVDSGDLPGDPFGKLDDGSSHDHDIIFGGLGSDFLHGGFGSDAISGAEALPGTYVVDPDGVDGAASPLVFLNLPYSFSNPGNPGTIAGILNHGGDPTVSRPNEFAAYDEFNPRPMVFVDPTQEFIFTDPYGANAVPFLLNFDSQEPGLTNDFSPQGDPSNDDADPTFLPSDGNDVIFGDLGHDWLVGGAGRDHIYGGFGDDLLNADDVHDDPNDPLNETPDPSNSYADIAFGGGGRDILIGNTGADRLIDWIGEFNSYIVPFAPFGAFHISRSVQPQMFQYLYDLSEADGADPTRFVDTAGDTSRNGEPFGEIGLVIQQDPFWQDQTGAPDDPQQGNIPGGARVVFAAEDFNSTDPGNGNGGGGNPGGGGGNPNSLLGFAADSGTWWLEDGALAIAPTNLLEDAVSVYHLENQLPGYFELSALISADKNKHNYVSNGYLIFDYQGPDDFKFAGINQKTDKIQVGHRDATGWHVDEQGNMRLRADRAYNILVAINGTSVTVRVDGTNFLHHTFDPRVVLGMPQGLNMGMIGIGANNSISRIDNFGVYVLPPDLSYANVEDFEDGTADYFTGLARGTWTVENGSYTGQASDGIGYSLMDLSPDAGVEPGTFWIGDNSKVELSAEIVDGYGGFIFDYVADDRFKFVALDAANDQVVVGHYEATRGLVIDASVSLSLDGGSHELTVLLSGTTVSVKVDGAFAISHSFNAVAVDGLAGVLTLDGASEFASVTISTDDPGIAVEVEALRASSTGTGGTTLSEEELQPIIDEAIRRLSESEDLTEEEIALLMSVTFTIGDLEGDLLATETDGTISLDLDAAGNGWFIDETPEDDEEFHLDGALAGKAEAGGDADGEVDLLTVILHEFGHVLGYDHVVADEGGYMSSMLDPSERLGLIDDSPQSATGIEESDTLVYDESVDGLIPVDIAALLAGADDDVVGTGVPSQKSKSINWA